MTHLQNAVDQLNDPVRYEHILYFYIVQLGKILFYLINISMSFKLNICLIMKYLFITYQSAILYRHDWSCTGLSVYMETELCGHRGGDRQSVSHRKVNNALWIITLCQGDVGELGGFINGSTSTHLVNLYQEPSLVLWFLQQKTLSKIYYVHTKCIKL